MDTAFMAYERWRMTRKWLGFDDPRWAEMDIWQRDPWRAVARALCDNNELVRREAAAFRRVQAAIRADE